MTDRDIDEIWERMIAHEGQEFEQIRGQAFTYEIDDKALTPSTTDFDLTKENFANALPFLPFENTVCIQHLFGPSYVYVILMDERISQGDW